MSQIDWYFARGNKQSGPVSSVDLKRLADVGELRPDDLVWREGLTQWAMARNVRGLFDENAGPIADEPAPAEPAEAPPAAAAVESRKAPPASQTPRRHAFDVLLGRLRTAPSEPFIDTTSAVFRACGAYGLLVAMVVNLGFAAILAVKTDVHGTIFSGVSLVLLLAALQYTAAKACGLLDRLNRRIDCTLGSLVIPDCVAVLSFLAALSAVSTSIAVVVEHSAYMAIPLGIAAFIVFTYTGIVGLRPDCVNAGVAGAGDSALGDEALAVLTFLVKCLMRAAPVAFGVGVMCATLALGYACYEAFTGDVSLLAALLTATAARYSLILFAALPPAAYLLLLLYGLILDLCRAILASPGKPAKLTPSGSADE